eukprot:s1098_g5.t1
MADPGAKFNEASELISKGKPTKGSATNDDKLKLYGLFKQAKEGDNTASAPWSVQWETKAKWEAWEKNKGKSKEAAMNEYIAEVEVGLEPAMHRVADFLAHREDCQWHGLHPCGEPLLGHLLHGPRTARHSFRAALSWSIT